MCPTVHLHEELGERGTAIDCETAELRGSVVWLTPADGDDRLVVPVDNLAGVEGATVEQSVERTPTQGGQYTEVVTRVE